LVSSARFYLLTVNVTVMLILSDAHSSARAPIGVALARNWV